VSKKLEEKQQRRLAEERKRQEAQRAARKRNLLTFGIALLVGALVVFLIINDRNANDEAAVDAGVSAADAGCGSIETPEEGPRNHVEDGTDVQYTTSPPTSGDHYATPADPGFYSDPVVEEQVVHNMEHGQVVVWYRTDAPQEAIDALESVVNDEPLGLLAVPYDNVPSGSELVFTAWGASQSCADFSNAVLDEFREKFQGRGPENVGIPTYEAPDSEA
jgi:hypothetical protein